VGAKELQSHPTENQEMNKLKELKKESQQRTLSAESRGEARRSAPVERSGAN